MKKIAVTMAVLAAGTMASSMAHADTDVFGTQQQIDGSYILRHASTEQFDPVRGQSVLARPRPDFDPTPIPFESFNLYPSIDFSEAYNNNIFAQPRHTNTDAITAVDPAVSMLSDWGRHALNITANGDINYYAVDNRQNFNSATVQADGRYDIAERTWFAGTAGYQRVTELRGNPDTPATQQGASQYNLYTGTAEAYRGVGLLTTKLDYSANAYEYVPIELIGGGSASQSNRDRTENNVQGEVAYEYTENMKPYVRVGYNSRDYTTSGMRSSNGYNFDVGARTDLGGMITAQGYVGYMKQSYYNFLTGKNPDGIDYGADVLWNITALTSLEGKASHSIEESTLTGGSSYTVDGGSVTLAHELRRDLVLESTVAYNSIDYNGLSQHEDYYYINGGARYFINRNIHTDLTYGYQRHETTAAGEDFDQHIVMARVGFQY
jgi:hypothetical protein